MLKAEGIHFRYNSDRWILDGIDLVVKPGEVVGLHGPSGYGKTTLARILAGYDEPFSGSVKMKMVA